jgi:hypothetical protein
MKAPTTKPTPPRTPLRWPEAAARDGRSRQERLAGLIRLGALGVRKAVA